MSRTGSLDRFAWVEGKEKYMASSRLDRLINARRVPCKARAREPDQDKMIQVFSGFILSSIDIAAGAFEAGVYHI